jgi:hypothetical protein
VGGTHWSERCAVFSLLSEVINHLNEEEANHPSVGDSTIGVGDHHPSATASPEKEYLKEQESN